MEKINKSEADWKLQLDPDSFHILRKKGTERPFSGEFLNNHDQGTYVCKGCGLELFSSSAKFDSGSGWPSFYEAMEQGNILTETDHSHGMIRTEIMCARCGGHLGHVFEDGPNPTGLRYCVNSASLNFEKK